MKEEPIDLLTAAIASLEESSWVVLGKGRNAFIRCFSRTLARKLQDMGYETPEEQLCLIFGEDLEIEEEGDRVTVRIPTCPFCSVRELLEGEVRDVVCVVVGLLEYVFDGEVTEYRRLGDSGCKIIISRE
ncbi:hypothetical protein [Methanopyrus sp.]